MRSRILKSTLILVTANWWVYTIYVIAVITSAAIAALMVEKWQLSPQSLVKESIVIVTVFAVVLPPLVSSPRKSSYVVNAGLVVFLLTMLYFPYSNRSTISLKGSLVMVLPLLLIVVLGHLNVLRECIFRRVLLGYLMMIVIVISAFGITSYYKKIIFLSSRAFENKAVMQYIEYLNKKTAYAADYVDSFEDLVSWVKVNTPENGSFFFMRSKHAQQFKLASRRPGMGSNNEIFGLASNAFKNKAFQDFIKIEEGRYALEDSYFPLLPGIMKKYGLDYIVLPKWDRNLLQGSDLFTLLFKNKHFSLFKLTKKGRTAGDYLAVHSMERKTEGPSHRRRKEGQKNYWVYEDRLISPTMKYPKGRYVINVTAGGKPEYPADVGSTLSVSIIEAGKDDKVVGRFNLATAPKENVTKEFEIESEDEFRLSFKKETLFASRLQLLEFDGVDDRVIIRFKKPLNLSEGTLAFWQAPGFSCPSAPKQSSFASPISLYTVDDHRFEFSNKVIRSDPYFWFAWGEAGKTGSSFRNIHTLRRGLADRAWNHWAGTWKRSKDGSLYMEFYLNGTLVQGLSVPADMVSEDNLTGMVFNRLEIGGMGNSRSFKGIVAEVRLFNRNLQPEQFMENPIIKNLPFLIGYWKLSGGCDQTVQDLSQSHNDGILGNNASKGIDDPQYVAIEAPSPESIRTDWLKDVMVKSVKH